MASHFALARYEPDGTLDLSFGNGGRVVTDFGSPVAEALAVTTQTVNNELKIFAAGYAGGEIALARYNDNGTLDRLTRIAGGVNQPALVPSVVPRDPALRVGDTFSNDGKVTTSVPGEAMVHAIAIDRHRAIVVAGTLFNLGARQFLLARYHLDGGLDTGFNGVGRVVTRFGARTTNAYALAIDPNDNLVVGGLANSNEFALARFHSDGNLDGSFGSNGSIFTDFGPLARIRGISISSNSRKITVAGFFEKASANYVFALARYHADGSLDQAFGDRGKVVTDLVSRETAQANGIVAVAQDEVVVAGTASNLVNGVYLNSIALARYRNDGSLHPTFGGGRMVVSHFSGTAMAVARGPSGTILVAGQAGTGFGLARFEQWGNSDTSFRDKNTRFRDGGRVSTLFPGMSFAYANAITVDSYGRIVLAGYASD